MITDDDIAHLTDGKSFYPTSLLEGPDLATWAQLKRALAACGLQGNRTLKQPRPGAGAETAARDSCVRASPAGTHAAAGDELATAA